jgi:hypothetical protein
LSVLPLLFVQVLPLALPEALKLAVCVWLSE